MQYPDGSSSIEQKSHLMSDEELEACLNHDGISLPDCGAIIVTSKSKDELNFRVDNIYYAVRNRETKGIRVPVGVHRVCVWNDFYASEELTVSVDTGQIAKLECGDTYSGALRYLCSVIYCFVPQPAGKHFYYVRRLQNDNG